MSNTPSALQSDLVALYRKALLRGVSLDELEDKIKNQVDRIDVSQRVETEFEKKREEKEDEHMYVCDAWPRY